MSLVGNTAKTLAIDLAGFAAFGALFAREAAAGERRIVQRQQVRAPGIASA